MATPTIPSSLIHVTASFIITAYCSTPNLTHPGDYSFSSSIQYGSSQHFRWTDTYNISLDLVLVQETYFLDNNTLPPNLDTLAASLTSESYDWDGEPTQDLSLSNLFWLALYNSSDLERGPLIKSQYFNVTSSTSSSSTASPSSTTSSSSSSSASSTAAAQTITTPASTTTSASPAPSSTPKSTSNTVALGAGLGAGLGGAALLLTVALFFLIGRKRQNNNGKPGRPEVYQLADNDTFSH